VNLQRYLHQRQHRIERALDRYLPKTRSPDGLEQAMRYGVFAGGKRLRPILALATCECLGSPTTPVVPFACAIEFIHAYSLIHDDLPAMDDDVLRRGKPTTHVKFGEATAILAGDALLTEAFRIMGEAAVRAGALRPVAVQALVEIAQAAGIHGMVGGQAADMAAEGTTIDLPRLEFIHVRKTGALIRAAVRTGALLGNARADQLRRLTRYADRFGLAFQVTDDILDAEAPTDVTGKTVGRDRARRKAAYPALLGLSASKDRARDLVAAALRELQPFGPAAEPLRALARFVVSRCGDT